MGRAAARAAGATQAPPAAHPADSHLPCSLAPSPPPPTSDGPAGEWAAVLACQAAVAADAEAASAERRAAVAAHAAAADGMPPILDAAGNPLLPPPPPWFGNHREWCPCVCAPAGLGLWEGRCARQSAARARGRACEGEALPRPSLRMLLAVALQSQQRARLRLVPSTPRLVPLPPRPPPLQPPLMTCTRTTWGCWSLGCRSWGPSWTSLTMKRCETAFFMCGNICVLTGVCEVVCGLGLGGGVGGRRRRGSGAVPVRCRELRIRPALTR